MKTERRSPVVRHMDERHNLGYGRKRFLMLGELEK